ncbi:MAG: peptidoglycan D,D-transpeptidase FtsI family protein [Acidobacteriota bacterium]
MVVKDLRDQRLGRLQGRRLFLLLVGCGLWSALLLGRLIYVQLVLHDQMVGYAREQQQRVVELPAKRGNLLDRANRLLASSIDETSIYVHPKLLPNRTMAAAWLAPALGVPTSDLVSRLEGDGRFVWLARKAPPAVVEAVRKVVSAHRLHLSVGFIKESKRYYPNRTLAAQVLGYVDVDNRGQAGVEYSFDEIIRGQPGRWLVWRDGADQPVDPDGLMRRDPTPGRDLGLTIDAIIQTAAESALERAVREHQAAGGSVVVMDPRTGAILALASYPTFNPNVHDKALLTQSHNQPIMYAYEPGSTFKMFTAAAAFQEGLVDEKEPIDCQGGTLRVANHLYHDWRPGFETMPFREVLVNSSNVGMIKVGLRLTPDRFLGWLRQFGFGEVTGIDLPGEATGILRATDRWSSLSQSSMVIGQEVSVTPLQLATAASAVANGGRLMQPYVVGRILDEDGHIVQERKPRARRQVIDAEIAHRLNGVLEGVVSGSSATATAAAIPGFRVAGKTGTAQKIGPDGRYSQYVASFLGILPATNPRLVVLVMIEAPTRGYYGSHVAAPAFRTIADTAIRTLRIPPDAPVPEMLVDGAS